MTKFGTDPATLSRTADPATSKAAAHKVDTASWEEKVYEYICSRGRIGATGKEAVDYYHPAPYSTITARFKALKDKGLIEPTGERREGAAAYRQAIKQRELF